MECNGLGLRLSGSEWAAVVGSAVGLAVLAVATREGPPARVGAWAGYAALGAAALTWGLLAVG